LISEGINCGQVVNVISFPDEVPELFVALALTYIKKKDKSPKRIMAF